MLTAISNMNVMQSRFTKNKPQKKIQTGGCAPGVFQGALFRVLVKSNAALSSLLHS